MGTEIRLLLVEDQTVVRQGLRRLLETEPELKVVGEADSVTGAVESAALLHPDVIIMDLKLGSESGIEAVERILADEPKARILVLSSYDDFPMIEHAIASGVLGYAPKLASFEELLTGIFAVAKGGRYIHPSIAERLMEGMKQSFGQRSAPPRPLTDRDLELLRCVSDGLSYRAIAERLYSSERSVRRHIQLICEKLEVSDRVQAVAAALRNGWL
jgi:DNA-binding NarL/FixJ family response regulator